MKVAPLLDARETATYVESLSRELREMARKSDLGFLAYLLSMVEDEARSISRQKEGKS